MGLWLVRGAGVKRLWKEALCPQHKHRQLSRWTGYPCKYMSQCWERLGMKTLLEIKLVTNFILPFFFPFCRRIPLVMLVGSAAFTARVMGELRYMTLYLHTPFAPSECCKCLNVNPYITSGSDKVSKNILKTQVTQGQRMP